MVKVVFNPVSLYWEVWHKKELVWKGQDRESAYRHSRYLRSVDKHKGER